jgi:hypothetical protein
MKKSTVGILIEYLLLRALTLKKKKSIIGIVGISVGKTSAGL